MKNKMIKIIILKINIKFILFFKLFFFYFMDIKFKY